LSNGWIGSDFTISKLTSSPYQVYSGHVRSKLTPKLSSGLIWYICKPIEAVAAGRMSGKRIGILDDKKDNKVIRIKLLHVHRCNDAH
jgi:hypothetical protein